ncbi:XrtA/PEP-CTERM system histidine kinase PrsK [Sphingopyxis macrogoltabida]|uniref:XrtA/PEP-CTERM system histidine kinase PrsK n=1 Tax=Sphingopyxis macrogoltabida TaxID=33050 RepID=UPI0006ED2692|nr:XrtA/PEP-CTERM system histidine kinase PrsK [Sphingopyxis macrogoltabida]ALJ13227.1 sensor signal transduction histidine kinase [Sphingopyxis macrogoltabida]
MVLGGASHILSGLALLGFVGVTLWLLARPRARMAVLVPAPRWLIAAAAATGLWCAALYVFDSGSSEALVAQSLRNAVMLGWLAATFWSPAAPMSRPLRLIVRLLVTISLISLIMGAAAHLRDSAAAGQWLDPALGIAAMIVASGGLLIIDGGVRHASTTLRMPVMAVAGGFAMLWGYELNFQLLGALTGKPASALIALLPAMALLTLPAYVVAAMDIGRERMQLSRTAAMRTIVLLGAAAYLIVIGLTGAVARLVGGDYGDLAQGISLIVALGAGGLLFLSGRARAWLSVTISKHFFEHRYDYRTEWMRFTATLGDGGEQAGPDDDNLHRRVAKALAELTGSPAALLMRPDALGGFRVTDHWHWPTGEADETTLSLRSAFMLQETRHIVELDALRRGATGVAADLAIPDWLVADPRAWVIVPVLHFQRMIAVVVLHRPAISRALDWEDLDVLRIAGQQAASYLAEAQSQQALSEARRFDEFNRRFAFIMHDIKNLASQLGLLARNAERHADKPEFRADMVETLKISAGRLSDLLVRLSPRARGRAAEAERVLVEPVLQAVAAELRPRRVLFVGCQAGLATWGDAASLRQIVQHLAANAIDASPPGSVVQLVAANEQGRVRIDVIDEGSGMSRAFVREQLFKPFVSTKEAGFGLGAFEALQLAQAMGGTIDVASEPGRGSKFSLWLPEGGAGGDVGSPEPIVPDSIVKVTTK